MNTIITIDKCQGCKEFYKDIPERKCSQCRSMPIREDGRPFGYHAEEIHITTLTTDIDFPPRLSDSANAGARRLNCQRFGTKTEAWNAFVSEIGDQEWLTRRGLVLERFKDWLTEKEVHNG